jgi:hypothetical protein
MNTLKASVKPQLEAYPITVDELFNHGIRAGSAKDSEELERERFNDQLNIELTKAFDAGREYEKATGKCEFNKT